MPGVEIIGTGIVLAHVSETLRASMLEESFRCRVSRVIVVQVEPNLLEARIVDVGQGTTPQVRGVQDDDGSFWLEALLEGQVGQEVHEAFEDLKQPRLWLVMHRDILSRPDKTLEFRVARFEPRSGRVS